MCCQTIREVHAIWVIDRPNGCECVAVSMCILCTNSGVVIRFAVTFIWVSLDGVWRMVCHSFPPELLKKVDGTSILCVCMCACGCVHLHCPATTTGDINTVWAHLNTLQRDQLKYQQTGAWCSSTCCGSWRFEHHGHPRFHFYGGTDQEHSLSKAQWNTVQCSHLMVRWPLHASLCACPKSLEPNSVNSTKIQKNTVY